LTEVVLLEVSSGKAIHLQIDESGGVRKLHDQRAFEVGLIPVG
jgi:hypothetical protein